jgi:hypothetical protein
MFEKIPIDRDEVICQHPQHHFRLFKKKRRNTQQRISVAAFFVMNKIYRVNVNI